MDIQTEYDLIQDDNPKRILKWRDHDENYML